ncbi:hypothetical protein TREPR_1750 [Treponema primitia ZAS-2]|uniref:Uncharacterized protein n=1 Tax=Treponema primitia (strain ATCC BAA-887 / DSM 12427 / ZAS-2) TaxID=545694 RepID=F5YM36_TREPZ|nr:hypothetical protein [Treponema primitia]AEF83538.1 hypothetical protein TREPR_1750 [Treponema primitia ZAS-2]
MIALGALAIFSGLSLNLMLQTGLGLSDIIADRNDGKTFSPRQWIILFLTVLILWLFFTFILSAPAFGFLESFLLFPAVAAALTGLELLFDYLFSPGGRRWKQKKSGGAGGFPDLKFFSSLSSGNGLALGALLLTLRLALSFVEAVVLDLGFTLGCLVSVLILREIRKRSSLEAVPRVLRGSPLILISMGLLSLIFSSISAIFLRVLGVF